MKRTIALLLVCCLCAGLLAGCGNRQSPGGETEEPESTEVYAASFSGLEFPEGSYLQTAVMDGGVMTLVVCVRTGTGEDASTVSRLYRVDADGTASPLGFELPSLVETDDARVDFTSSEYIERLFARPDGSLLAVVQRYSYWYQGTAEEAKQDEDYWERVRSESAYRLLSIDGEGRLLGSAELQLPPGGDLYVDFQNAGADAEGRIYAASDAAIFVFDAQGALAAEIPTSGWTRDFVLLRDGRVLARLYGAQGEQLCVVDAEQGRLGQSFALEGDPYRLYEGFGDWDLLFTGGTALYGWTAEAGESRQIADLLASNVIADDLVLLGAAPDGTLRGLCREQDGERESLELVTLTVTQRDASAEPEVLTLGALYPDAFSRAVQAFNRSQQDVRIELRDYSALMRGEEDYETALTRLSAEILSGDMPDLLALDGLPYRQLAGMGLLEDLYPYLDADPQLSRGDFFASALKSMEVGGGLYQAAPSFMILSLMGASSVVGDTPGWTYDELNAALSRMPEGCTVLGPYAGRDEMLEICVYLEMDRLVDWETGFCRFDSEDFIKLLEFVNGFPQNVDYGAGGSESASSRIASGKQLVVQVDVSDPDSICVYEQLFGGDATYIGFPTSEGVGNILYVQGGVAMSSACRDKAAAWSFLRQLLSADYRGDSVGGLPINRAAFDRIVAEAMEAEYEKDENGDYRLDPETGERIPLPKGGGGMSEGGDAAMEYTLWPMTERQRDKLLELIECSTRSVDMNATVFGIVRNLSEAYFSGQKSAGEVARLIQSKVSLYVNEQR
ncbi:MAG: extracellular solute-binding protein [Oscillospiraceae bacterium]|nr:extracellular solute-binding protein [Oscillospiraceae bacterium]